MLDAEIILLTATLSGQPVEECNGHSSRQHSKAVCCTTVPIDKQQTHKPCCSGSDGSHVLLRELLQGNFTSALLLPEAQQWLRSDTRQTSNGISDYFEHVRRLLVEKQAAADRWHQLQTAVACLLLFLQANLTGCVTVMHNLASFLTLLLWCLHVQAMKCMQASSDMFCCPK